MIVSCPECTKRYQVEDQLIQGHGRQVRCAACGHVWMQAPDVVEQLAMNPQVQAMRDVTAKAKPRRKFPTNFFGWASFILFVLGFGGYILITSEQLATQFPQLRHFQALLNITHSHPGDGLSLQNTRVNETSEGHFVVRGDVLNVSDQVKGLTSLRVKALGKNACEVADEDGECVLKEWQLDLDQGSLLPGEQLSFESSPYPLIKGTEKVGVSF